MRTQKRLALALVFGLFIAILTALGSSATLIAQASGDNAELQKVEEKRSAALRAGDVSVLDRLLMPDYTEVDVNGRIRPRTQALSLTPDSPSPEQVMLHAYKDAAVVVCREGDARILRVWVRQSESWRLVTQQAVRIQPGAPGMKPTPEVLAVPRVQRTNGDGPLVREVLTAQTALDRANSVGDPKAFESLTASDFIQVTNHGMVRAKAYRVTEERLRQLSDQLNDQGPRPIPDRDDTHVRVYGDLAILTARSWPRNLDLTPAMPSRFTRVWRKGREGWQQVATITTMLSAP
jgi:hypothetical protein